MKRIAIVRYSLILMILVLQIPLMSCKTSSGIVGIPSSERTAVLLYAENVEIPETIYANQTFTVQITASANRMPGLLDVLTPSCLSNVWNFNGQIQDGLIRAVLWVDRVPLPLEPVLTERTFEISYTIVAPGEYKLVVETADSKEWGGSIAQYSTTPSIGKPEHEHAVVNEYSITVLPPDEGDGA